MAPSPFHGIFGAFGNDSSLHGGSPKKSSHHLPAAVELTAEEDTPPPPPPSKPTVGQIAVDIYEQDNYYIIRAPLAGVRLSDLDIETDDRILTIHGRRAIPDSIPRDQYYLQECFWGEFSRSITLPCAIDPKKVKATFNRDCILKIIVPKEEKVKVVRIMEGG